MARPVVLILGSVIVLAVVAVVRGRSVPSPGAPTAGFVVRRIWAAFVRRPGAATRVPYDSAAIARSPTITWIGHSAFLVRMDGVTFLTDPMFSDRAGPLPLVGPPRLVPPGVPLAALPKVDFALLSHDHYDHADFWSVKQLARRGVRFIVPVGLGEWVTRAGGQAIELAWWQSVTLDGVRITCVPAQHFSGRSLRDHNRRLWAGWVGERFGPFDLAAVPIGAYRPADMMHLVHTTPEEALRIGLDVRARRIVAMHFGTFDLADEPLDEPPQRFRSAAEARGLGLDRVWILKIGETRGW